MKTTYLKEQSRELTINEIVKILFRRKWIVVSIFVSFVVLAIFYVFSTTPKYEAIAKIKIPTGSSGIGSLGSAASLILGSGAAPDVITQQEIITSRMVIKETVKQTNLFEIIKREMKDNKKNDITIDDVVDEIKRSELISVTNIKNSAILELRFEYKDKDLALLFLTKLIEVYTKTYIELNKDEKTAQYEIVKNQIPQIEQEIAELAEKIKEFKLTKSVSPSEEGQLYATSLTTLLQEKYATESEIETTKRAISKLELQINTLKDDAKRKDYTPTSEVLEKYRENLAQLQTTYSSLLQKYTEDHPEVKSIKAKISQLEVEIDKEIKRIASSKIESPSPLLQELYSQLVQNQLKLDVLRTKLNATNKSIADIEEKMKKLPSIEQEYLKLERDYKIKQTIYSALVQKYEELKLTVVSVEINKPQVIDPPYVPDKPSKPKKRLIVAISGVLGLFLGVLGAFLVEMVDKRIISIDDIQSIAEVPIIVQARQDLEKVAKVILKSIFVNYPDDRKISIVSPDDGGSVRDITKSIFQLFEQSQIKYELIELTGRDLLVPQVIEQEISEKLKLCDYVLIGAHGVKDYESMMAAKHSDGVIVVVRSKKSEKSNLLEMFSIFEKSNVKIYGIVLLS